MQLLLWWNIRPLVSPRIEYQGPLSRIRARHHRRMQRDGKRCNHARQAMCRTTSQPVEWTRRPA